jgi:hypothetical protein
MLSKKDKISMQFMPTLRDLALLHIPQVKKLA